MLIHLKKTTLKMVGLFIISSLFFLNVRDANATERKKIIVVFRYDDYSAQPKNTVTEAKIIEAFKKFNIQVTFGVIPFVLNPDGNESSVTGLDDSNQRKVKMLRDAVQNNVVEIALHGYTHQDGKKENDWRMKSEFSGLDINSQIQKLNEGKKYLETVFDTEVSTFIPPWNSYDLNTIRALEQTGFKTISATILEVAKETNAINFLPATASLSGLRKAVESARFDLYVEPLIVVKFHPFDFKEANSGRNNGALSFNKLYELLEWVVSQKDIKVLSISKLAKSSYNISSKNFADNKSIKKYSKYMPLFLPEYRVYYDSNTIVMVKSNIWKYCTYTILLYSSIVLMAYFLSLNSSIALFQKWQSVAPFFTYGISLLTLSILIYSLHDFDVAFYGSIVIIAMLSLCTGTWIAFLRQKKNNR